MGQGLPLLPIQKSNTLEDFSSETITISCRQPALYKSTACFSPPYFKTHTHLTHLHLLREFHCCTVRLLLSKRFALYPFRIEVFSVPEEKKKKKQGMLKDVFAG